MSQLAAGEHPEPVRFDGGGPHRRRAETVYEVRGTDVAEPSPLHRARTGLVLKRRTSTAGRSATATEGFARVWVADWEDVGTDTA